MGVHIHSVIMQAKQVLKENSVAKKQLCKSTPTSSVPKGYLPVYVGEAKKRRVLVPVSYLNHTKFQKLLEKSMEEFDFGHAMGGLITIPCKEENFIDITSQLKTQGIKLMKRMSSYFPHLFYAQSSSRSQNDLSSNA